MQLAVESLNRQEVAAKGNKIPVQRHIEIMDTTLRDGEQTSGVSFSASEKLTIAQVLLTEVKVDRIEIASARVSEGEFNAVKKITEWAGANGFIDRIEVLLLMMKLLYNGCCSQERK
jgi:D-citramalate synthase